MVFSKYLPICIKPNNIYLFSKFLLNRKDLLKNCYIKDIHLHSQFTHNLLTMWVTMWKEFLSHCDSQYQMTLEFFLQYLHILVTIFSERRDSSTEKIVQQKKHREKVNFGPISEKFIFLKWKQKTGLNGSNKCPKFEKKFEREHTANFAFAIQMWLTIWAGKPGDKNSAHNVGDKYSWIPLMSDFR